MKLRFAVMACLVLGACAGNPLTEVPERRVNHVALPPMKYFAAPQVTPPARSNQAIARDFLNLTFRMESGREVPILTRFEEPVTVAVAPGAPPGLDHDLDALLARFRREARIDIRRTAPGQPGNIMIETLPRADLQRLVPQAACFVVPRVSGWAEYRRLRRTRAVDWATLKKRETVAVFLPSDVSPQEVRDCLHEELAQALGPLNDLYSLPDSIFNDDNFHTVLTGFDMLILRAYYAPELQNGMTEEQVAARLPALLARLNPHGEHVRDVRLAPTPRTWIDAIETALGPGTSGSRRLAAAKQAVIIARGFGPDDTRLAFSLFALGRLSLATDAETALTAFLQAGHIYGASPVTAVQEAHVGMHLAAFSLSAGQPEAALSIVNAHLPPVVASQNAALLATMLMIKAEALDLLGRASEAQAVRLDSLGWARYGFGTNKEVRARLLEIAALSPGGHQS
ncbi:MULTISPECIES: DUF2927 domain-containing protein [Actibacterium]|uniref:ATP-dependent transcriptional regulator n=1 Tax=Actibacterium naphthalenivorans TaxID=1614693 RepID=A0A840CIE0_9RHOB|nr:MULTISPECIES: DUF2927 domain-containing protein [Actibacterium]MBB4021907.1 hypothetical protein [Actibacterium naphthalenivorans]